MGDIVIRPEHDGDRKAIRTIVRAAFAASAHGLNGEDTLVDALRSAGALSLSLVAEDDGQLLGHVAISPITVNGRSGHWFGLGPLSVIPARQKQGIGQQLVDAALAELRAHHAAGCVLLGDPSYYQRFGFRHDPQLTLPGFPAEYFLALPLGDEPAAGTVAYHPAFAPKTPD